MVLGEVNNNNNNSIPDDVLIAFKAKTSFMKSWKPASNPSNRDRLELYSLHKQAVAGDAPIPGSTLSSSSSGASVHSAGGETPAEKAKYNAWRSKAGLSATDAMKRYVIECDRQISMYGTAPSTSSDPTAPSVSGGGGGKENTTTLTQQRGPSNQVSMRAGGIGSKIGGAGSTTQQQQSGPGSKNTAGTNAAYQAATATAASTTLRGLAAIPLICAAASEDRQSYLRRLQNTTATSTMSSTAAVASSWWKRQEPLTAPPGTIMALPEHILLWVATVVERVSLAVNTVPATTNNTNNGYNSVTSTDLIDPDASPADDSDEYLGTSRGGGGNLPSSIISAILPPAAVIQSFLWPVHNCLLALWIEIILLHAILLGAFDCFWTVLWGSKSTGKTLPTVWNNHIRLACIQSIYTVTDPHQPITARCVGLLLWPAHVMVQTISLLTIDSDDNPPPGAGNYHNYQQPHQYYPASAGGGTANQTILYNANIWTCLLYTMAISITLWYWISVVPFLSLVGLYLAFWVGGSCFALIELAGV